MNKKTMIIIISVTVVILLLVFIFSNNKKKNMVVEENKIITSTMYNEEESTYKVVDKETGEVLYEGNSEEEAYLYQIDPTYKPSNPDVVDEYEMFLESDFN